MDYTWKIEYNERVCLIIYQHVLYHFDICTHVFCLDLFMDPHCNIHMFFCVYDEIRCFMIMH